jgi:hypothetical protein
MAKPPDTDFEELPGDELPGCTENKGSFDAVKSFIEEYGSGIIFGVIVLLVAGYFIYKHQSEKAETIHMQQKISTFAKRYNAVTDWEERFDKDGIKIGKGHRPVYTTDIENALIRNDGRPVLIVGSVFDVTKIGDKNYLGIKAFA